MSGLEAATNGLCSLVHSNDQPADTTLAWNGLEIWALAEISEAKCVFYKLLNTFPGQRNLAIYAIKQDSDFALFIQRNNPKAGTLGNLSVAWWLPVPLSLSLAIHLALCFVLDSVHELHSLWTHITVFCTGFLYLSLLPHVQEKDPNEWGRLAVGRKVRGGVLHLLGAGSLCAFGAGGQRVIDCAGQETRK